MGGGGATRRTGLRLVGGWYGSGAGSRMSRPKRPGPYELLYDVTVDGREAANLAAHHPDVVTDLRDAWDRFNDTLLPYPSGHRGLPPRDPGNELERSYAD